MEIFLSAFEYFTNVTEYALIVILFVLTLGYRKGRLPVIILIGAGLLVLQTILNILSVPPFVNVVLFGILDIVYACLFFESSRTKRFIIGIAPSLIFNLSELIAFNYLNFFLPVDGEPAQVLEQTFFRLEMQILYICINTALFILLIVIFRKAEVGFLPKKMSLLMVTMIFPTVFVLSVLINLFMYTSHTGNRNAAILCAVASGVLFVVTVGVYVLFTAISRIYEEYLEQRESLQKSELEKQHYADMYEAYEKLRIWRHDSINRIRTLEHLVQNGESTEVKSFLQKATGEVHGVENLVNTGHPVIDAILSNELSKAKRAGIQISPVIILPDIIPFDEMDLCTVISNLLDNAIEAVKDIDSEKKYIDFEINVQAKSLVISVVNPSSGVYRRSRSGKLFTTKADSRSHGLGLKIVASTVEKMNGVFEVLPSSDVFDATVILPLMEVSSK